MADFNLAYAPVAKWDGGWTHDSGDKGAELLLWIEHAEELCR